MLQPARRVVTQREFGRCRLRCPMRGRNPCAALDKSAFVGQPPLSRQAYRVGGRRCVALSVVEVGRLESTRGQSADVAPPAVSILGHAYPFGRAINVRSILLHDATCRYVSIICRTLSTQLKSISVKRSPRRTRA